MSLLAGGPRACTTSTPASRWRKVRDRVVSANAYLGAAADRRGAAAGRRHRHHRPRGRCLADGRAGGARIRLGLGRLGPPGGGAPWPAISSSAAPRSPAACGATGRRRRPGQRRLSHCARWRGRRASRSPSRAGSGGAVNVETVAEQLLYEVGDPAAYLTPDVVADFTSVRLARRPGRTSCGSASARGKPATDTYKVSIAYRDGFTASGTLVIARPGRGRQGAAVRRDDPAAAANASASSSERQQHRSARAPATVCRACSNGRRQRAARSGAARQRARSRGRRWSSASPRSSPRW